MSLLMDALKKAEQEKKEAANRADREDSAQEEDQESVVDGQSQEDAATNKKRERTVDPSSLELTLAPIEPSSLYEEDEQELEEDLNDISDAYSQQDSDVGEKTSEVDFDVSAPDKFDEQDKTGVYSQELNEEDAFGQDLVGDEFEPDLDQTFVGLDDKDKTLSGLYEETIQGQAYQAEEGEHSFEETLPGVSAYQMAKDIGGDDQPTPVAAQTVFIASGTTHSNTSWFKWLLLSICVVVLAVSVLVYQTTTPLNLNGPSPLVAKGIETIVPAQPVVSPLRTDLVSGTLISNVEPAIEDVPVVLEEEVAAAEVDEQVINIAEQEDNNISAGQPAVEVAEETPSTNKQGILVSDVDTDDTLELSPGLIKISRSKKTDDKGLALKQAYVAYKQGDYESASVGYKKILEQYPDNRDALLGLGAISVKKGENLKALELYARSFKLNPQDKLTRAMLINLNGKADIRRSESAIKVMIQENPGLSFLHFTLGNVYAGEERWAEAQQSFFDAYRMNSSNPDYALNLAVSLDRLGQATTALDYYNVALKLADESPASFDPSTILLRINIIEGRK